jgi:hypothetical protein
MDFRLFFEQIKQLTDPAIFAIIAKFAILFYGVKILFKFIGKLLKVAFDSKEKYEDYLQTKKDIEELKKASLENKERDLKTHKLLEAFQIDLNAYKQRTHAIENEKHALVDLVKSNMELIQKMEKYVK